MVIKAPAKLNLGLKVTGRRPDGYHELISLMVPVSLFDKIQVELSRGEGIDLRCEGREVPGHAENLGYKAALLFRFRAGLQGHVSIRLSKKIPVAAGLGGGSSDAAAVLIGLNILSDLLLSQDELSHLAREIGADVPFFLVGCPALAKGIGNLLKPIRPWVRRWYVVVKPPISISTAWVFQQLIMELTTEGIHYNIHGLKKGTPSAYRGLKNDLETVTVSHFPVIDVIKKQLIRFGAEVALMTGSGPTVFGVFSLRDAAVHATHSLTAAGIGEVFLTSDWERP
jgi:4-diphosphocytidyl-2-C-methyl-D-erythritol kinase